MVISKPEIQKTSDGLIYQVRISDSVLPEKLWYKVNNKYGDFVSGLSDAALAGLFIPAMQQGENITLEGDVSEELLFHINHDLQFQEQSPGKQPLKPLQEPSCFLIVLTEQNPFLSCFFINFNFF